MPPLRLPLVSRRDFVRDVLVTVTTACGALGVGACGDGEHTVPVAWQTPALLAALGTERVLRIGASWRAQHPRERSVVDLRAALWAHIPALAGEHRAASAAAISRTISNDFETGRIVVVDGWILSVTEARQCALYHAANG